MTLNEFKKEAEEEVKLFIEDWEEANLSQGDSEFPMEMDIAKWWLHFFYSCRYLGWLKENQDGD